MIDDHHPQDIRALFDWRQPASDRVATAATPSPVANDDLALALNLLSCNARDRQQFQGARGAA